MAEIFWIKDGTPGEQPASAPARVDIERLEEKLVPYEKKYYDAPPSINPAHGPSKRSDPFRHVLVRVHESEIDEVFPEAGYYHIVHLAPFEAAQLLGYRLRPANPRSGTTRRDSIIATDRRTSPQESMAAVKTDSLASTRNAPRF